MACIRPWSTTAAALIGAAAFVAPSALADEPAERVVPPPPSFEGKVFVRDAGGRWVPVIREPLAPAPTVPFAPRAPGWDTYIADGEQGRSIADSDNSTWVTTGLNQGWIGSTPLAYSSDAATTYSPRTLPTAAAPYTASEFDYWDTPMPPAQTAISVIWRDTTPSSLFTRPIIARSSSVGGAFSLHYQVTNHIGLLNAYKFDRDRTTAEGGGAGSAFDNRFFTTFDNYGSNGVYQYSVFQVVSGNTGVPLGEMAPSTAINFHGAEFQPCAGVTDGVVYLMGVGASNQGATTNQYLFSYNGTTLGQISTFSYPTAGQRLGTTDRFGFNGFRVGLGCEIDIDRSLGPHRGRIYAAYSYNPNPSNATLDQGDIGVSYSDTNGTSWTHTTLMTKDLGKSQYFPNIAVDRQGGVHVSYYQNDAGPVNSGVLNATEINVYYTFTRDFLRWKPRVKVNDPAHAIDLPATPLSLGAQGYFLLGDYQGLSVAGRGPGTRSYVTWTQYDKDRANAFVGDKKTRIYVTQITDCMGDYNNDGLQNVTDIFDFLRDWFGVLFWADINGDDIVAVADIFVFLAIWFGICP